MWGFMKYYDFFIGLLSIFEREYSLGRKSYLITQNVLFHQAPIN
ncbi:MAG: hypothetical protein CFH41_02576 [Alphaproteobacteria bacterium MarineAlpha11_Bin1]|nr:MAG: hypothetical protein CFH41_02576 [Alphaproteobacteria bacterium MarineAlpha11_Bin1]